MKPIGVVAIKRSNAAEIFLMISLVLFFVLDIVNGIYFFLKRDAFYSISYIPKMFWQLLLFYFLLKKRKEFNRIKTFVFLFYFITIIYGVIIYNKEMTVFVWEIKHLNKLFLFFFVYIFIELYKIRIEHSLEILDWLFFLNSFIILIGLIFSIEFFKSYPFSERFGFNGVFPRFANGDVSFFYLIGNFYLFIRWKNKQIKEWLFLFVLVSSFIVGTKAIYFQNLLLFLFLFFTEKDMRKYIIIFGGSMAILLFYFYNFSFWEKLYNENGLVSVLTSQRNDLFREKIPEALKSMTVYNLLFGFSNPSKFFVEMDLIDLLLTMGIMGATATIFFYKKILLRFNAINTFAWFFVFVFVVMISVTSRYMYSGTNAVIFPLFLYYLKLNGFSNGKSGDIDPLV